MYYEFAASALSGGKPTPYIGYRDRTFEIWFSILDRDKDGAMQGKDEV
jgi:hypothetical protein